MTSDKIRPHHLDRKAILYVRQSSSHQVSAQSREPCAAIRYARSSPPGNSGSALPFPCQEYGLGGVFSFLPVLGLWMLPLGLLLLAHDVPFLRKPVGRFTSWGAQRWAKFRRFQRAWVCAGQRDRSEVSMPASARSLNPPMLNTAVYPMS